MGADCRRVSRKGARISKIGVGASEVEGLGKRGRHRLSRRRDVATSGPAEELGPLSYAAACEGGATEAEQQGVLGDGAAWITTQAQEHSPEAVKILDWPHLWRNI